MALPYAMEDLRGSGCRVMVLQKAKVKSKGDQDFRKDRGSDRQGYYSIACAIVRSRDLTQTVAGCGIHTVAKEDEGVTAPPQITNDKDGSRRWCGDGLVSEEGSDPLSHAVARRYLLSHVVQDSGRVLRMPTGAFTGDDQEGRRSGVAGVAEGRYSRFIRGETIKLQIMDLCWEKSFHYHMCRHFSVDRRAIRSFLGRVRSRGCWSCADRECLENDSDVEVIGEILRTVIVQRSFVKFALVQGGNLVLSHVGMTGQRVEPQRKSQVQIQAITAVGLGAGSVIEKGDPWSAGVPSSSSNMPGSKALRYAEGDFLVGPTMVPMLIFLARLSSVVDGESWGIASSHNSVFKALTELKETSPCPENPSSLLPFLILSSLSNPSTAATDSFIFGGCSLLRFSPGSSLL
ncbi:hypothetical protein NE237_030379 [Protea cynaroides]|uniref:Uncharacterized protein n=1 Tax=Protea cynaroides TaxID=273540 RepID=A0A9Q0GX40_9MAGN|nr:hypothetical protein NE237_030379 [Protea cynaroides]